MVHLVGSRQLDALMPGLGVKEEDIEEKFIRSQGHGGQNINKVSTCVYLKHIPTGIEVKCQKERTQGANRLLARELLLKKIQSRLLSRLLFEKQQAEKSRRQKRRRSRKAKLRMLESKRKNSQKKAGRKKVYENDY